jgi:hypothetical protein
MIFDLNNLQIDLFKKFDLIYWTIQDNYIK